MQNYRKKTIVIISDFSDDDLDVGHVYNTAGITHHIANHDTPTHPKKKYNNQRVMGGGQFYF